MLIVPAERVAPKAIAIKVVRLILHVSLDDATRTMMGTRELATMKPAERHVHAVFRGPTWEN